MVFLLAAILFLYAISFGLGQFVTEKFGIHELKFKSSIGFIALLALCQLCFFPIQLLNGPFILVALIAMFWIAVSLGLTIKYRNAWVQQFKNKRLFVIGLNGLLFLGLFYFCFIDIEFSDSIMYLNYVSQNIDNPSLNMFHLYTGLIGSEWDTIYLYQGYYHFIGALIYWLNIPFYLFNATRTVETLPAIVWGMGLLYQLVSSGFICDMVDDLKIDNKLLKLSILIFSLFYTNYYYWKLSFAFYGNTWRSLLIWVVLWMLVKYKQSYLDKKYVPIIQICLMAGLASSSSFFFISFELLFGFFVYLLFVKEKRSVFLMADLVFPIVIYAAIILSKDNLVVGIAAAVAAIIYYAIRNLPKVNACIESVTVLISHYSVAIFIVGLPLILIGLSLLIKTKNPDYIYNFTYWMQDHQRYDMVKDYRFMYGNWIDNVLTAIRYLGIVLLIIRYRKQASWLLISIYVTFVIFINPFSTEAISRFLTGNVFYRAVEIVFNPYTEAIFILVIVDTLKQKWVSPVMSVGLLTFTAIGHVASFMNSDKGLYHFYINGGKEVNPIFKINNDELDAIYKFRYILDENGRTKQDGSQVRVISQVNGLRVFEPSLYQLFTPRDYFYPHTRLDNTFYLMASNHYDWIDYPGDLDYSTSCDYLYEYGVDYLLIKYEPYYANYQFDDATNACAITLVSNDTYKIKQVVRD